MPTRRPPGVWIEPAPGAGPEDPALMIRHPGNPFIRPWPSSKELHELAFEYVSAYAEVFRLNRDLVSGLAQAPLKKWKANRTRKLPGGLVLRWLPIGGDPRNSFLVHRNQKGGSNDQSGILLAALWAKNAPPREIDEIYLGPDAIRLRVVFHVFESSGRQVRFTGMSRSFGEPDAMELEGDFEKPNIPRLLAMDQVYAEVLPLDPPSEGGSNTIVDRRPNRPAAAFKPAQKRKSLGPLPVNANQAALQTAEIEVLGSALVQGDPWQQTKRVAVKKVSGQWEMVENNARKNEFAAVNAFYHTKVLVGHLKSCGIDLDEYFRCANLPIWVRYRSGIARSSDGRVRNADTVWGVRPDFDANPIVKGEILLRYALGDHFLPGSHLPNVVLPVKERFPLGIACDVRWNCHEFGHVLLMASVGEREFRFAHSAGDSIAAILTDPDSDLALPKHDGGWRGVTFPWVELGRRHDRTPASGWAWGGAMDRRENGYWKEQILSSTLFRLYQTLGGDAITGSGLADAQTRKAASDHTIFLIMRAIGLLGAAEIVPASTPDQFVSALMDADISSALFVTSNGRQRVGGNAHKVVRWAFERQGLYPAAGTELPVSVPGDAPPVDVYIASPLNGTYSWQVPAYQIVVNNPVKNVANPVQVTVGNRGANAGVATNVALWAARANAGIPDWLDAKWQKVDDQTLTIPARSAGVAAQLNWTPNHNGPYALLAIASCEEDRANTLPATEFPCAVNGSPIPQLLVGDNNLGLAETVVT